MNDPNFQRLLDLHLDGGLDSEDLAEFESILLSDQTARTEFWRRSHLHQALSKQADESRGEQVAQDLRRRRIPSPRRLAAAAALVASAILAWSLFPRAAEGPRAEDRSDDAPSTSELLPRPESALAVVAVVSEIAGAEWAGPNPYRKGQALGLGELVLESGQVGITFFNGAHVTVEGPARLKILSESSMELGGGEASIECPEVAHGFTVITPNGRVVDLGTVFSLSVKEGGATEVRVVEGLVSLRGNSDGEDTQIRERGIATIDREGNVQISIAAPDHREIGIHQSIRASERANFLEWREASDRRVGSKDLLVYLRMLDDQNGTGKIIENEGGSEAASETASVISTNWVDGRWPGKRALSFQSAAERARVTIDGSYNKVTFVAWVKIAGFLRPFNALFMSDRQLEGEVHWQFSQSGGSRFSARPTVAARQAMGGIFHRAWDEHMLRAADNGVWQHIATVYDADQKLVIHYLNGEEKSRHIFTESIPLSFSRATIGNTSYAANQYWGSRQFGGAVGEFAIYSRALDPTEIVELHEEGRPD